MTVAGYVLALCSVKQTGWRHVAFCMHLQATTAVTQMKALQIMMTKGVETKDDVIAM